MKKIIFFVCLCLAANILFAQPWLKNLPADKAQKGSLTLHDYSKAFDDYWQPYNVQGGWYTDANGVKRKAVGWKNFKRWQYEMQSRVAADGSFPTTNTAIEYDKYVRYSNLAKSSAGNWKNLGTNTSAGGYSGIGRVNCVAFHPTDNNTFWIGSPAGGLWKTTNGGTSWTVLTDKNPVLGVSEIIIPSDYATSKTIYIATGDRDGGDNNSIGVLKSTDDGATWQATGLTFNVSDGVRIHRLILHPSNNQVMFAATDNGIYKTTNGATSWTKVNTESFTDIAFKPGTPATLYAVHSDYWNPPYLARSTDNGSTWQTTATFNADDNRCKMAVSAANPAVVYVIAANHNGGVGGIYKSTNSGTSFTEVFDAVTSGKNILGYEADGSGDNKGQGWYDLCIAASPSNANVVFVGGINTWKSNDGGVSWTVKSHWWGDGVQAVHADKHTLTYRSDGVLFEGNDGGIYKTTDGGTNWTDLTNGIVISQIYRIGTSKQDENYVICGLQDNGTKLRNGATWSDVKGGDGMECIIDHKNKAVQYGTYVEGQIDRTTDTWTNDRVDITGNIPGGKPAGSWVTPYVMDPVDNTVLYVGYSTGVWKATSRGDSWAQVGGNLDKGGSLSSLAIAPSNNNVLYTTDGTNMWKTTTAGSSWTDITSKLPPQIYITYITVHPTKPQTLWITCGGYTDGAKIFQSTDGGTSWTNISNGLPNIPAMCVVTNKNVEGQLYAGTDVGVFVKNGTDAWIPFSTGLPNVVVRELEIWYHATTPSLSKIRAATYGRGLWESDLYSNSTNPPTADFAADQTTNVCKSSVVKFSDNSSGSPTSWQWTFTPNTVTFVNNTSATSQNPEVKFNQSVVYSVSLKVTNAFGNNTATKNNYISIAAGKTLPFVEDFQNGVNQWQIDNVSNNQYTWNIVSAPSAQQGNKAMFIDFWNNPEGDTDGLYSPLLDLTGKSNTKLTFVHAHATYDNNTGFDTLSVYASGDCGDTWTRLKATGGKQMETSANEDSNNGFVPTGASEWCNGGTNSNCITVDLSAFDGKAEVFIAFEAKSAYNNNLYIDDVKVDGSAQNAAPIANAGPDQTVGIDKIVTLDASASSDPDGNTITYKWTAPNGITLSSNTVAKPNFTAPVVSTNTNYTFSLVVNDGMVSSTADEVVVTVQNAAPIANAGLDQTVGEGNIVTLDASVSSDPDGKTITYQWTAPNGITLSSNTVAKPNFTAPLVNANTNYTFSLVVNDGMVASTADEVVVTVQNTSGIDQKALSSGLLVYPNPNKGNFTVKLNHQSNDLQVRLFDAIGRVMFTARYEPYKGEAIDVLINNPSKGLYMLEVIDQGNTIRQAVMVD